MKNKQRNILIGGLALTAALATATVAADDVLERIKPVGQVNIAQPQGQAQQQAPAAAPAAPAAAATEAAPATAAAEPAPAAATAPAAAPAAPAAGGGSEGQALYQAKGCAACHGADGKTTVMPVYPKLAGQSATYLVNQMLDIKSGKRSNGQTAVMKGIIAGVSEAEIKAIAEWLASQQP